MANRSKNIGQRAGVVAVANASMVIPVRYRSLDDPFQGIACANPPWLGGSAWARSGDARGYSARLHARLDRRPVPGRTLRRHRRHGRTRSRELMPAIISIED